MTTAICGKNYGGVLRPKWQRRFAAKMPAAFRRQTRQWRPLASWSPPICAGQGRVGRRGLIPAPILRRFKVGRPTVPSSGRKRRHLRWLAVKRRKNGADLHLGMVWYWYIILLKLCFFRGCFQILKICRNEGDVSMLPWQIWKEFKN